MDLVIFLRFITRIRVTSNLGLVAAIALGVMIFNGVFDPILSIVLGIVAGVLLVAGIGGLIYAQKLTDDVEESFHRNSFNLTTAIIQSAHQAKTAETADGQEN